MFHALILGVLCEHSMPATMANVIINTAKELVKDKKALDMLSLDRTTVGYKMVHGMQKTFRNETLQIIR